MSQSHSGEDEEGTRQEHSGERSRGSKHGDNTEMPAFGYKMQKKCKHKTDGVDIIKTGRWLRAGLSQTGVCSREPIEVTPTY